MHAAGADAELFQQHLNVWLNPPDSCLVIDTVTGCLPKCATASRKSSSSREAMSCPLPSGRI